MTALLTLLAAGGGRAEPLSAAPQAHASFLAMSAASPQHQRARLSTALEFATAPQASGVSATFGWLEATGEILLMSHGPYPSAAQVARSAREVESAAPIHTFGELPRYLLICSWREDGADEPPTLAYAERDDANAREHSTRSYASLSVPWVPTAARRAQQPFAGHDWCGELAHDGRSSAPLWQANGRPAVP
ncbi:hypothetical protein NGA35_00675 [Pseudomonas stutzeri]|nr:hypothetical protein [Stutzerimonas stutzeri]